jgi:hypothetical protein
MSASAGEVARPTLCVRGLLGRTEPILITGGRAVADYKEAFVRIDVAKLKNTVAIADAGWEGQVRFFGEVDASATNMRRTIHRIARRFDRVRFCYEAGPTGYGLYRLIRSIGALNNVGIDCHPRAVLRTGTVPCHPNRSASRGRPVVSEGSICFGTLIRNLGGFEPSRHHLDSNEQGFKVFQLKDAARSILSFELSSCQLSSS